MNMEAGNRIYIYPIDIIGKSVIWSVVVRVHSYFFPVQPIIMMATPTKTN